MQGTPDRATASADKELGHRDRTIREAIADEDAHQERTLCLVASSGVTWPAAAEATSSAFANITTEGYPGRRYHAGSHNADVIERTAIDNACRVFGAQYANVQSHSASTANLAVLTALLAPGETVLSMDLKCGGHLTHGSSGSLTGRYFRAVHYGVDDHGRIDMAEAEQLAKEYRPAVIVCGSSSYPRVIDFARFRHIADENQSTLLADISHPAGLVAAGLYPNPVPYAHVVTLCTHKQLFGPKGGLILSGPDAHAAAPRHKESLARLIDRAIFPYFQGSPDMGAIAGKAVALELAATAEFRAVMARVKELASLLARVLQGGLDLVSGGTDSHMVVIDLRRLGLTGAAAEELLEAGGILANRNLVPGDKTAANVASGLRLGTNVPGYRGLSDGAFGECCGLLAQLIDVAANASTRSVLEATAARTRARIAEIMALYPLASARPGRSGVAR